MIRRPPKSNSTDTPFPYTTLVRSHRTMMVLDEAHYLKSADGRQATSALRLAPHARGRVILTGPPAPNGYEDLANLFRFLYQIGGATYRERVCQSVYISVVACTLKKKKTQQQIKTTDTYK